MKKGDVLIIVVCTLLCIFLFALTFMPTDNLTAQVYLDGEVIKSQELSQISNDYSFSVSGCELLFSKDGVSFVSSDCKDKLCIKHGKLSKNGDTMACVPNRVVVCVKQGKKVKIDAVAY